MAKYERVKFVGERDENGVALTYLSGVPARDMDADEWYALDAEARDDALRLGLYEGVAAPKSKKNETEPAAPGEGGG